MADVKVLTLNVWGLVFLSKDLEERMKHISEELAKGRYDIVTLQEIWAEQHFDMICEKVKEVLPYTHYFHSGVVGSGCATLSRYPIIDSFFMQYKFGGNVWNFLQGDWFAGKGLGCVVLQHPVKNIYVFNTHLHANYPNDPFTECRTLQLYQTSQILKHVTRPSDAVLFCGDLNHTQDEIGIQGLLMLNNLNDTYDIAYEKPERCFTIDKTFNKYVGKDESPSRIDYILASDHFECTSASLVMQKVPEKSIHFSDHEGYEACLKFKPEYISEKEPTSHASYKILKQLYHVMIEGERCAGEIHRRTIIFVLFLLTFIFMPVLSSDSFHAVFPPVHSFNGKVVFMFQVAAIIFCAAYLWIVVIIRQIDTNSFKDVKTEIQSKLNTMERTNNMKID